MKQYNIGNLFYIPLKIIDGLTDAIKLYTAIRSECILIGSTALQKELNGK